MFRSQLAQLNYKTKTIPRPLGGGLNNGFGFDSRDNEFSEVRNVQTRFFPSVRPRFPRTDVGAQLTGPMYHLGKRLGDYITAVDNLSWKKYEGGSWVEITTLTEAARASSVDFLGKTYIVNGTDRKSYDGATAADVTEMPLVDLIDVFSSRLYAASRDNDSLYFSAIATGEDWSSPNDAGEIQVTTNDGQFCTGLVNYNNHIMYFKQNSVHELYGTNPNNFYMQTLTNQIGSISPRSIIEVEGILYFAGSDGIYQYGGGVVPSKISYPFIQQYFDDLDESRYEECVAGTDGDRLYMILPIGTSDRVLVTYNTDTNTWSAHDDVDIVEFEYFDNKLYGMQSDGQLVDMIDPDGDWSTVSGFFITKAFDQQSISSKKAVKQVHVAAELAESGTIEVFVSSSAKGNDFVKVGEITDTALSTRQFIIPTTFTTMADWNRIKVGFTGDVTIYNMEIQLRVVPNNY